MSRKHPSLWVIGFTVLIINPGFACGPSDPADNFEYGETEMVAAVEGTWRLTISRPEGPSVITFSLEKGPAPTAAPSGAFVSPPGVTPQCGSRTFMRPAAACFSMSSLALAANVVEAEPAIDATTGNGYFLVYGLTYSGGQIELKFGADLLLTANLNASNAVTLSVVQSQGATLDSVLSRAER
jgi:hypothetical protein